MNPDRLAELQRQRAIVRDHLAWLENEIAAATGAPALPARSPAPRGQVTPASSEVPRADITADPVLAATSARRGCLLYAAALLLAGLVALTIIYFIRYRDRPLVFMSRDQPTESRK